MRTVTLPDGTRWPALGAGTWRMGESASDRDREIKALRYALEIGFRVFDTAEMYGDGGAEEVLGQALREAAAAGLSRDETVVVSKFYPQHADPKSMRTACERSLRRLGIDCLDLYLLHWRGGTPLAKTIEGLQALQSAGWIRRWGVSNFDLDDMQELVALAGGEACSANQVYYSLTERGIEFDLYPWQGQRGMPVMAYCPIDQGRLSRSAPVRALAQRLGMTAAELALAWVMSRPGVMAIPKAVQHTHLMENWRASNLTLDAATLAELDRILPPPSRRSPLAMS